MKERPIIFSAPMVRALLDGTKIQTRRTIRRLDGLLDIGRLHFHSFSDGCWTKSYKEHGLSSIGPPFLCPYGAPGDRLWVRETLQRFEREPPTIQYAATLTGMPAVSETGSHPAGAALWQWGERKSLPSIFMPRWASRILLEVTEVRAQRLHDISEEDARAEGATGDCPVGYIPAYDRAPLRYHFAQIWETVNGRDSWTANPFVWAVSFKRIDA